jgi:hypothetical protein
MSHHKKLHALPSNRCRTHERRIKNFNVLIAQTTNATDGFVRINSEKILLDASDAILITKAAQGNSAVLEVSLVSSVLAVFRCHGIPINPSFPAYTASKRLSSTVWLKDFYLTLIYSRGMYPSFRWKLT